MHSHVYDRPPRSLWVNWQTTLLFLVVLFVYLIVTLPLESVSHNRDHKLACFG